MAVRDRDNLRDNELSPTKVRIPVPLRRSLNIPLGYQRWHVYETPKFWSTSKRHHRNFPSFKNLAARVPLGRGPTCFEVTKFQSFKVWRCGETLRRSFWTLAKSRPRERNTAKEGSGEETERDRGYVRSWSCDHRARNVQLSDRVCSSIYT